METYDFFALFDTRLDLRDIPLRLLIKLLLDIALTNDSKPLLGVELTLAHMSLRARPCRHDVLVKDVKSGTKASTPQALKQPPPGRKLCASTPNRLHALASQVPQTHPKHPPNTMQTRIEYVLVTC